MRKLTSLLIIMMALTLLSVSLTGCKRKKAPTGADATGVPGTITDQYPVVGDMGAGVDVGEMASRQPGLRMPAENQVPELRTVYFAYDSSDISAEGQQILDGNVAYLQANPGLTIQVEGHCDERGTNEYNYALAQRRADSVRDYMVSRGVPSQQLNTISYGEDRPVAPGSDEAAWAQNRRVQFMSF